jgi:hypothetical protein
MKLRQSCALVVALFLIAALAACGKTSASPTDSFKAFYDAAKKKDAASIKRTISKRMLAELEIQAKKENKALDEYLVSVELPATMPEARNEKIEGDTATVEFKLRSGGWRPINFVREDGEWKLDSE